MDHRQAINPQHPQISISPFSYVGICLLSYVSLAHIARLSYMQFVQMGLGKGHGFDVHSIDVLDCYAVWNKTRTAELGLLSTIPSGWTNPFFVSTVLSCNNLPN
jgi:hypothetical protein